MMDLHFSVVELDDEMKSQDADTAVTSSQLPVTRLQLLPGLEDSVCYSVSEKSSNVSKEPVIKISNNILLRCNSMIGDSDYSESQSDEITATLCKEQTHSYSSSILQRTDCESLDQDQARGNVKMLEKSRRCLNLDNLDPLVSLQSSSLNESGFTSFLNITGLTENLPFSFDSLQELKVHEITKARWEENEDQLDFSPTDGSDFNPDEHMSSEHITEDEFYDDEIVKRDKKRRKKNIEKVSKKILNEKKIPTSSKHLVNDASIETRSPKAQMLVRSMTKQSSSLKDNTESIRNDPQQTENDGNNSRYEGKLENTKRSWTRRNACLYCQNVVTNFTRHLLRHHANEIDVIKYKSVNDEDPKIRKMKRQEITDRIRNKGNFLHNSKVCFNRDGTMTLLPTKRRAQTTSSPSSFATCKNCLGTFKRATFFRHFKKCGSESNKGRVLSANSITIVPNTESASKELKEKILPHLRADEIALAVKNDQLILAYGTRLLKKKKERRSRKSICSKMRDLATLLIIMRKRDDSVQSLSDAMDPEKYELFIESVKKMCGFNEDTGYVNVPSVPARILPAVLGCVDILYTQCIMGSESTAFKELFKKKLDEFKHLVTINWQWEISSNAEKTKKRLHMTKEKVLPLEDDIKTTMEMINKLEVKYAEKLKNDCNVINYESLCTVTIAHIIMLDRKRSGDVAEAELTFYINRRHEEVPEDVLKMLTPTQQKMIDTLDIFQIPGKRTRSVPILLTKTMRENIDLIIACRDNLKIPKTNPLLFARSLTQDPFDGGKCLNNIKNLCNLKRPDMLTSTGMRHHIATMSQIHAKQNDQYTEHLAGFLGHDVSVHAKNYRLPLQVLQKAVVGSQLMRYETQDNRSVPEITYTKQKFVVTEREAFEETNRENPDFFKGNCEHTTENNKEKTYCVPEKDLIISNLNESMMQEPLRKMTKLPLEDDTKTTMEMINKLEVIYAKKLRMDCNVINYESLCTVTIAHIVMLDKEHTSDVTEAELIFYINRRHEKIQKDVLKMLTPAQQQKIYTLDIFQIPGKKTPLVPILLTNTMRENIDLIIDCRDELKIPKTNPLLFARPVTRERFDSEKCLNSIKLLCDLKRPEMFKSTGMRPYISTTSQIQAIQNDQHTEHLAVHAKNYRFPLQVSQKPVVCSQLMTNKNQENRLAPEIKFTEEQLLVPGREDSKETNKNPKTLTENSKIAKVHNIEDTNHVSEEDPNLKENMTKDSLGPMTKKGDIEEKLKTAKLPENIEKGNLEEDKMEDNLNKEYDKKSRNTHEYIEKDLIKDIEVNTNTGQEKLENTSFEDKNRSDESILKNSGIQTRSRRGQFKSKPVKEKRKCSRSTLCEQTILYSDDEKAIYTKDNTNQTKNKLKNPKIKKAGVDTSFSSKNYDDSGTEGKERKLKLTKTSFKKVKYTDESILVNSGMNTRSRRGLLKKKTNNENETNSSITEGEENFFYPDYENRDERLTEKKEKHEKRNKSNQTETKVKKQKPKKARLDTYFSSEIEDYSDQSCEESVQKKTRKRPIKGSNSEDESPIRRRKKTHRFWSDKEVKAVHFYFKHYIANKMNPGKAKCMEVLKKEAVLQSRTWMQLNTYVNNIYKNKMK